MLKIGNLPFIPDGVTIDALPQQVASFSETFVVPGSEKFQVVTLFVFDRTAQNEAVFVTVTEVAGHNESKIASAISIASIPYRIPEGAFIEQARFHSGRLGQGKNREFLSQVHAALNRQQGG